MSIHCISFWEDAWLVRNSDRQQWNHVTGAYECTFKLYRDGNKFVWDDAVHNPTALPVYLFDESGVDTLYPPNAFQHPTNGIYVFGNTGMDITTVVPVESRDGVIKIVTPVVKSLWGCEAAAVVLAHRYKQVG